MLLKTIIVFLGLMFLIALIGRALFPSALPRVMRRNPGPAKCRKCGRHLIGKKPCDCAGHAR